MKILYTTETGILIASNVINACASEKGVAFFETEDLHGEKSMVSLRCSNRADAELAVRTLFQTGMFDVSYPRLKHLGFSKLLKTRVCPPLRNS